VALQVHHHRTSKAEINTITAAKKTMKCSELK